MIQVLGKVGLPSGYSATSESLATLRQGYTSIVKRVEVDSSSDSVYVYFQEVLATTRYLGS